MLVHGTWARGAPWTNPTSDLRSHLLAVFGAETECRVFNWSGRNSLDHRKRAAEELRALIADTQNRFPGRLCVVVAHSHGGNVAMSALSAEGPFIMPGLVRIICLATPFLQASPRAHDRKARKARARAAFDVATLVSAAAALLGLVAFALLLIILATNVVGEHPVEQFFAEMLVNRPMEAAIYAGAAILWIWFQGILKPLVEYPVAKRVLRSARGVLRAIPSPAIPPPSVLIFRPQGDEASAALSMVYLAETAVTLTGGLSAGVMGALAIIGGVVGVFVLPILLLAPSVPVEPLAMLAFCVLLTVVAFQYLSSFFPSTVGVPLLQAASLGWDAVLASPLLQITAEPSPPGQWTLVQLPGRPGSPSALRHSSPYSDPTCLDQLSTWVREALAQDAATANPIRPDRPDLDDRAR